MRHLIPVLSAALLLSAGARAQSLFDFPGFGRQQAVREQENTFKLDYDVDFRHFLDVRGFGASDDIFMDSGILNVARISPSVRLSFTRGKSLHKLVLGTDLSKDLGTNPTTYTQYSTDEDASSVRNAGLFKDIFYYYTVTRSTARGSLSLYAGIHPKKVLEGDYGRIFFSDESKITDPNLEGFTFQYRTDKFLGELSADMPGSKGLDRMERYMVFGTGEYKPFKWASAGLSASCMRVNGSSIILEEVECAIANPFIKVKLGESLGLQEFTVKAGGIASYQFDHKIGDAEKAHFPLGAEAVINLKNWNFGLENTAYYGDNMMVYKGDSYRSSTYMYTNLLYLGEPFYNTHRGYASFYDRIEAYYQPGTGDYLDIKFSAIGNFINPTSSYGPFIGWQGQVSLTFNLEALRHPRTAAPVQQGRRTSSPRSGPRISL